MTDSVRDGRDYVLEEIRDRVRRIEMRQTKFYESQGFDTRRAKPKFRAGEIEIPSLQTSIKDIWDSIPEEWQGRVLLIHHGQQLATMEF